MASSLACEEDDKQYTSEYQSYSPRKWWQLSRSWKMYCLCNYADVGYQKQIVGLCGHDPLPQALPRRQDVGLTVFDVGFCGGSSRPSRVSVKPTVASIIDGYLG